MIPIPQIIEMHMEIIDEFAKQLRIEGRSDETLLDYRLTLIDILAHLCEVYRCSVAKIS
jgi:circadian clock protein KaiA